MHEVKPYVVTYAFFGFTIHHGGSKMTVARPCVCRGYLKSEPLLEPFQRSYHSAFVRSVSLSDAVYEKVGKGYFY